MIAEYNASNVLQRRYVSGPGLDEPLVWYEGSGTTDRRWLIADERGSVVAITNSAGAVTNINTYDAYGVPGAANVGRFQYTGQMWLAEAGVYHYRARAYIPQLGRFAQTDPIGFGGGMNLYAYVANDPVNFVDPLGLAYLRGDQICYMTWYERLVPGENGEVIIEAYNRQEVCSRWRGGGSDPTWWDRVQGLPPSDGNGQTWEPTPPTVGQRGFQCPSAETVHRLQTQIRVGESFAASGGFAMVGGLALQRDVRTAPAGRFLFGQGAAMAGAGSAVSGAAQFTLGINGHEQSAVNATIAGRAAAILPAWAQPAAGSTLENMLNLGGNDSGNTCPTYN